MRKHPQRANLRLHDILMLISSVSLTCCTVLVKLEVPYCRGNQRIWMDQIKLCFFTNLISQKFRDTAVILAIAVSKRCTQDLPLVNTQCKAQNICSSGKFLLVGSWEKYYVLGRNVLLGNRQFRVSKGISMSRIAAMSYLSETSLPFPPPPFSIKRWISPLGHIQFPIFSLPPQHKEGLNFALWPHSNWPVMSGHMSAGKLPSKSG